MEEIIEKTKFCKYCDQKIAKDAVICIHCGRQVEELKGPQNPQFIINNSNSNVNTNINKSNGYVGKSKNKWIPLLLCIFTICGHKFYKGRFGIGVLFLFTVGLFGIGWILDIIAILTKSNPYYV